MVQLAQDVLNPRGSTKGDMQFLALRTLALDGGALTASQCASSVAGTHWTQNGEWAPKCVSSSGEEKNTRLCRELYPAVRLVTYVTDGGDSDVEFSKQCYLAYHATVWRRKEMSAAQTAEQRQGFTLKYEYQGQRGCRMSGHGMN